MRKNLETFATDPDTSLALQYGGFVIGDAVTFERQADLLFGALFEVAPNSERLSVPGLNHQSIVIAMSADGNQVSDATLRFLARRSCGPAGA